MRLGDLDALKKELMARIEYLHDPEDIKAHIEEVIDNAPTVDVETQLLGAELHGIKLGYEEAQKKLLRPQGEWIHYLGCGVGKAVCSECGQLGETKKYCGNCGAEMRKGGAE